ncbi:MAG TPA: sterol desaturase family protein [Rhizomicrobium sp.]|jgi:sterol desaturase/sphingolipid hydroxylase (fatty acid hydroxylase superfamily)|nr:sterol desaturase family protein [Rhizomicrobium sp.]
MTIGDTISGSRQALLAASPRLFRNPLLDRLSRVHHLLPTVVYLPVAILLLYVADHNMPAIAVAGELMGGYVLWTLLEYFGHRFLFHYHFTSTFGRRAQFLMHGVHHDHPNDPLRLVMPPLMSLPIMTASWVVLRVTLGPLTSMPVLAGLIIGYLVYDMFHYHLHHAQPKTGIGRFLRIRHMHHHFRDDTVSFGVSAPWWDYVFGTRASEARR